jgi:hypothetical protein
MNPPIAESTLSETGIRLPEPDKENITVLTHQLPNEPILPWHHYDSPWLPDEMAEVTDDTTESENNDESTEALNEAGVEVGPTASEPLQLQATEMPTHLETAIQEPAGESASTVNLPQAVDEALEPALEEQQGSDKDSESHSA